MNKIRKIACKYLKTTIIFLLVLQGFTVVGDTPTKATNNNYIEGVRSVKTWSKENGENPETLVLLDDKKTVLSSGYNLNGVLGRGITEVSNMNMTSLFAVSDTSEVLGEIETISISSENAILLDNQGEVYLAGQTNNYAKGDGTTT
ncbi:MAG: hypothetical protein ACRC6X_01080, partial [Culicoidibacterales bacterium]